MLSESAVYEAQLTEAIQTVTTEFMRKVNPKSVKALRFFDASNVQRWVDSQPQYQDNPWLVNPNRKVEPPSPFVCMTSVVKWSGKDYGDLSNVINDGVARGLPADMATAMAEEMEGEVYVMRSTIIAYFSRYAQDVLKRIDRSAVHKETMFFGVVRSIIMFDGQPTPYDVPGSAVLQFDSDWNWLDDPEHIYVSIKSHAEPYSQIVADLLAGASPIAMTVLADAQAERTEHIFTRIGSLNDNVFLDVTYATGKHPHTSKDDFWISGYESIDNGRVVPIDYQDISPMRGFTAMQLRIVDSYGEAAGDIFVCYRGGIGNVYSLLSSIAVADSCLIFSILLWVTWLTRHAGDKGEYDKHLLSCDKLSALSQSIFTRQDGKPSTKAQIAESIIDAILLRDYPAEQVPIIKAHNQHGGEIGRAMFEATEQFKGRELYQQFLAVVRAYTQQATRDENKTLLNRLYLARMWTELCFALHHGKSYPGHYITNADAIVNYAYGVDGESVVRLVAHDDRERINTINQIGIARAKLDSNNTDAGMDSITRSLAASALKNAEFVPVGELLLDIPRDYPLRIMGYRQIRAVVSQSGQGIWFTLLDGQGACLSDLMYYSPTLAAQNYGWFGLTTNRESLVRLTAAALWHDMVVSAGELIKTRPTTDGSKRREPIIESTVTNKRSGKVITLPRKRVIYQYAAHGWRRDIADKGNSTKADRKLRDGHARRLPDGWSARQTAQDEAATFGIILADGYTFVNPEQPKTDEQRKSTAQRVRISGLKTIQTYLDSI